MARRELTEAFNSITPTDEVLDRIKDSVMNAPAPFKKRSSPMWALAPVAAAAVVMAFGYALAYSRYAVKPADSGEETSAETGSESVNTTLQLLSDLYVKIKDGTATVYRAGGTEPLTGEELRYVLDALMPEIEGVHVIIGPTPSDAVFADPAKGDGVNVTYTDVGEGRFAAEIVGVEAGDEVTATADGEVIFAGVSANYGNAVVIKHENLWIIQNENRLENAPVYYTLYGLCDALYVSAGDRVLSGQTIATVGPDGLRYEFCAEPESNAVDIGEWIGVSASPRPVTATLAIPIGGSWYVSAEFGDIGGKYHNGIDFSAEKGTDILAAEDGEVVFSGNSGDGYGNYIVIKHSEELYTLYAHCDELFVSAGDGVSQGQTIATVGETGFTTGCNLHFEVMTESPYGDFSGGEFDNGFSKREDPRLYLPIDR